MSNFVKSVRVFAGTILVIIGLIGGLIPIFQGWIFGVPGLMLLGSVFPSIKRWSEKLIKKYVKKDSKLG